MEKININIPSFEVYSGRLRRLKNYKDLSDEEFLKISKESYDKKYKIEEPKKEIIKEVKVEQSKEIKNEVGVWNTEEEAKEAEKKYKKYREQYPIITNISDLENLKNLIFFEIQLDRIKIILNKDTSKVSGYDIKALNECQEQILKLKEKLAIGLAKKEESTFFEKWKNLQDKVKHWNEQNQGTRHLICPNCAKQILLKIRTDKWESQKHPFFQDKILTNKKLIELYLDKKLTKEDIGEILECSPLYIDWLIERWKDNPEYLKYQEKIKEYLRAENK